MAEVSANKRITLNTIFLYLRMILLMVVSLYTSRVVLASLGASDYGIYNVVGGITSMFVFLNYAMTNSTQRYITYELGKGNMDKLNKVFSLSMNIHVIIGIIIVILTETIGLWFLYNKLVIPAERLNAAFWALQLCTVSVVVNIISVPYNALIIAHEKMSAFAYISILDAVFKLLIAYLISIASYDRLIVYAILILIASLVNRFIYNIYCNRRFKESHYHYYKDWSLMKEMSSFAGWSLTGNIAYVAANQGLNILLNTFFSPVVNAARGIAVSVQSALTQFSTNIENAIKPQITKSYAISEFERLRTLCFVSARFSYYALLLVSMPIMVEIDYILGLWLKDVPDHTANFAVLTLIMTLIDALSNPLLTISQATGNVKKYQLTVGLNYMLVLPVSYIALRIAEIPELVFVVGIAVCVVSQIIKMKIVCPMVGISIIDYFKKTYMGAIVITVLVFLCAYAPTMYIASGFGRLILITLCSSISLFILVYFIAMSRDERVYANNKIRSIINKHHA